MNIFKNDFYYLKKIEKNKEYSLIDKYSYWLKFLKYKNKKEFYMNKFLNLTKKI